MATTATDIDLDSALGVIRELFINSLCSCGGWKCPRCLVTVQEAKELLPACPVCDRDGRITDEVKCDACSGLGICLYDSIDTERLKAEEEEGKVNYLFLVVSETLYEHIPILDDGSGPDEPYKIVCLVSAETREQARWAAWRTDRTFDGDARDMPNFRTRKIGVAPSMYGSREVIEEEFDEDTGMYKGPWEYIPDHVWKDL